MKKTVAVICMVLCAICLSACVRSRGAKAGENAITQSNLFDFNQYDDASDVPSWAGHTLKLKIWAYAGGPNASNKGKVSQNDVVTPEIRRITGVEFDKEGSFDNNGDSFDVKAAKLIAAGEYPHVASSIVNLAGFVSQNVLWRLDEYLPKYAPNLYRYFGPDTIYGEEWERQMKTYGGVYDIPSDFNMPLMRDMEAHSQSFGLTQQEIDRIVGPDLPPNGYFYIRDDILKMIYPETKTCAELKDIYTENGKFTKEQMLDVPINSPEDFIKLLYKIKALNIQQDGKEVYPIYVNDGGDNWALLVGLGNMMGYNGNYLDANYFTYWDKESKRVEYAFCQSWFKDLMKTYNRLVRDGVASPESLLDTDTIFKEKLNNGMYAVSYYFNKPDEKSLADKPYQYRKVYANYEVNSEKFLFTTLDYNEGASRTAFFKTLSEQELIQTLRAFDFMASDPGQKLSVWGPRSAGLFFEKDGRRFYTDKELEAAVLSGVPNDMTLFYNLKIGGHSKALVAWPGYPGMSVNKYHPMVYNTKEAKHPGNWLENFDLGYFMQLKRVSSKTPALWKQVDTIPEVKKFWETRQTFEDALKKVLAANSDSQFEKLYSELLLVAEQNGLTEETLIQFNTEFENYNQEYMNNLK